MALILGSGPLLASFDRRDSNHLAARKLFEEADEPIILPSPILPEVDCFVHSRLNPEVRLARLHDIRIGPYRVEDLVSDDYDRIGELCRTYREADIGFVDAAVFAVVERLKESKLATLDRRHFSILRPRHVSSLELLP